MKRQSLAIALIVAGICTLGVISSSAQDVFTVNYFANNNVSGAPDATVRVTNPGTHFLLVPGPTADDEATGNLCAMVYVFDNDQQAEQFPAGHAVFREGDRGDRMFAVLDGSVDIIIHGKTVETVEPGGVFGEMALVEATPKGYKLKGSFRVPTAGGNGWPHPVIYHGRLYLRGTDQILCYDIKQ